MIEIILSKILLGMSLAMPIGTVNSEMIKRGLTAGFCGAFNIRLGASIVGSIYLLIAYFGLGQLMKNQYIVLVISNIGIVVLFYMGITTIIKAYSKKVILNINKADHTKYTKINGIITGMMLASFSPVGLVFWLTSFTASITIDGTYKFTIINLLINYFVIIGTLIWGSFISGILHFGSKIINPTTVRIISGLSGLLLIYFGIKYGMHNLNRFL